MTDLFAYSVSYKCGVIAKSYIRYFFPIPIKTDQVTELFPIYFVST